jgi:methylated-DNA-protein-cysteine methyltransferase related protein
MAASAAFVRIKADVLAIAARIPPGRVATHKQIGEHLQVMPRHVAYVLATLDELGREAVPWWRVVADGGAIGRHLRRDEQMRRLRDDGVVLSPVGIVQDLAERWIADVDALIAGRVKAVEVPSGGRPDANPSRSRGIRGAPKSSA